VPLGSDYQFSTGLLFHDYHIPYIVPIFSKFKFKSSSNFSRGFSNNLQDWITIDKNNLSKSSNFIKETLDFENNPDDYMIEKIDSLNNIINVIDKPNWVNLYTPSFLEIAIDRSDDNDHPGELSNKKMANEFIDYYKEFTF
jgi:hypothetical protein